MANEKKDTIYIDVDDEITAIIDKLSKSDSKIVALVLPKRTAALQSIVNMKLLKRAAADNGKKPVLITSEKTLLPLAGATGMYVAKNLNSKPEIPSAPDQQAEEDEELEAELEDEKNLDKSVAVGALAGAAAASTAGDDEAIDMQEESDAAAAAESLKPSKKSGKSKSKKSGKGPKVPNFEKFRKKFFLIAGGIVGVVILFILAVVVLPKATIVIQTNTESVDSSFEFIASPSASQVDTSAGVVPAKVATQKVSETQTAPATGQKDLGAKATGNMTFSIPCSAVSGNPPTIPAGTGVSTNGLTFITQNASALTTPNFSGGCTFTGTTTVAAQNNGEQYNIDAATYTVSGFGDVTGKGGQMTGGSSKVARVVTSSDIDIATGKITAKDEQIKQALTKQLEDQDYFVVASSFRKDGESTVPTPAVDQEANEVSVTYNATYVLVGIKRDDMKKLIENDLGDQIDTSKQQVQEDGLDQARFTVNSVAADGDVSMTVSTKAEVGPDIDTDALIDEVLGKKRGDTENIVKSQPGVKDVEVKYSPFWVSKTPKSASKITVEFKSSN